MGLPRMMLHRAKLLAFEQQDRTPDGSPRAICVFSGVDDDGNDLVLLGRVEAGSGLSYRYRNYSKKLGQEQQYCDLVYYYNRSGRCIFESDNYCLEE